MGIFRRAKKKRKENERYVCVEEGRKSDRREGSQLSLCACNQLARSIIRAHGPRNRQIVLRLRKHSGSLEAAPSPCVARRRGAAGQLANEIETGVTSLKGANF